MDQQTCRSWQQQALRVLSQDASSARRHYLREEEDRAYFEMLCVLNANRLECPEVYTR